jgi:hypothetical protein
VRISPTDGPKKGAGSLAAGFGLTLGNHHASMHRRCHLRVACPHVLNRERE